ncbi:hypothetical protein ACHAPO_003333 [Fusarium lateritium]
MAAKTFAPDAGVMSAQFITFGFATILLICRLVSRKITHVNLWWDDYFAMTSWVAAALYFSFAVYWTVAMGLGHIKEELPLPEERVDEYARFGLFMAELLYATSLGFSKLAILPNSFAVLSLPIFQVKRLKLRTGQKIAVVAMFMFGIFVCIASIIVLYEAFTLNPKTTEMARDIRGVIIWAGVESYLAIISSCLPIIRPVFRKLISGSMLSSKGNSTGPNPISGLTSSKGIKLTHMARTKEVDDNSSQRELAGLEDGSSGDMDFHTYPERGGHNNTVVTSCVDDRPGSNSTKASPYGIQVKNETRVHYESWKKEREAKNDVEAAEGTGSYVVTDGRY